MYQYEYRRESEIDFNFERNSIYSRDLDLYTESSSIYSKDSNSYLHDIIDEYMDVDVNENVNEDEYADLYADADELNYSKEICPISFEFEDNEYGFDDNEKHFTLPLTENEYNFLKKTWNENLDKELTKNLREHSYSSEKSVNSCPELSMSMTEVKKSNFWRKIFSKKKPKNNFYDNLIKRKL